MGLMVDPFTDLGQQEYAAEQWVAWCRLVISHAATTLRRKYRRWEQDGFYDNAEMPILSTENVESDSGSGTFSWVEWRMLFQTELSEIERCVVHDLYINDESQRQVAHNCAMSQAQVSRVQRRACQKLREALRP